MGHVGSHTSVTWQPGCIAIAVAWAGIHNAKQSYDDA